MINFAEDIKPISYVKAHTAEVFKQVEIKNNPMIITQNGEAKIVLMDVKYYQNMIDTISLLKILSIGESDIKNGRFITQGDLDNKVTQILEA
jgi:prevent-host-death family protein